MKRLLILAIVASAGFTSSCLGQETYRNATWNFCVRYPAGWEVSHPVDEYAVIFTQGQSLSMSFGVIRDNESLEDNFRTAYISDSSVSVVQRESVIFRGRQAIVATVTRDTSPQTVQHIMTIASGLKGVIYEFQLTAPDLKSLNQHMPIFKSEVESFRFDCK